MRVIPAASSAASAFQSPIDAELLTASPKIVAFEGERANGLEHVVPLCCDFFFPPSQILVALLLVEDAFRVVQELLAPFEQQVRVDPVVGCDLLDGPFLLQRLDYQPGLEFRRVLLPRLCHLCLPFRSKSARA